MKKQKICIIGDGLTGLFAANALKNPKLEIHIYAKKEKKTKYKDFRVTAVSDSNYRFLASILNSDDKSVFNSCREINLYYEHENKIYNFLNFKEENKTLMHIFENLRLKNILIKRLRKNKIKIIDKEIKNIQIIKKQYDLVFLCLGKNSHLYRSIKGQRIIHKDYKEVAVTGIIKHSSQQLNPKQYFLKKGPLALLPINQNMFSFVWSLKNNILEKKSEDFKIRLIKNIKDITGFKSLKIQKLNYFPIKMNIKTKYSENNLCVLGEGLHSIHPIAGQGFNLVLRDIKELKKLIDINTNLGLDLKNSNIFKDFNKNRSSENIIFGLGIDFTRTFFKTNKLSDPIKNILIKNLDKIKPIKEFSKFISDRGLLN